MSRQSIQEKRRRQRRNPASSRARRAALRAACLKALEYEAQVRGITVAELREQFERES